MFFAPTILAFLGGLSAVSAQSSSISFVESVRPLWPTGVSVGSTRIETTLPLACYQGCFPITASYYACFINATSTVSGNSSQDQQLCDDFFCSQGNYTQLLDCANCIIANGDERPVGYHTNTALTATSTQIDGTRPFDEPVNPFGLIDEEQLNRWLTNVTERCSAIDRPIDGPSTATATPTTTGPYFTSFRSGETISYPTWTGMTQYSAPVFTVSVLAGEGESGGGGSASSGSGNSGNGSPTSSAAPSESSPANHAISGKEGSAGLTVLGMIVGYVVVQFQ